MTKFIYIEKSPGFPEKGLSWIEIDQEVYARLGIPPGYDHRYFGGFATVTSSSGQTRSAWVDNPASGRKAKHYKIYAKGEVFKLSAQPKLSTKAILEFIRSWDPSARVQSGNKWVDTTNQKVDPPGFVYFLLNSDSQAIKIGIASDVQSRFKDLQTATPVKLKILGTIEMESYEEAKEREKELQSKFASLHIRGEWFQADQEIYSYISRFC